MVGCSFISSEGLAVFNIALFLLLFIFVSYNNKQPLKIDLHQLLGFTKLRAIDFEVLITRNYQNDKSKTPAIILVTITEIKREEK
jgi:hypothetical protein